jgi:hypothetical protein
MPFAGVIDAICVEDPVPFPFEGSVSRAHVEAAWTWVYRDLCPDIISADAVVDGSYAAKDLEAILPVVLSRINDAMAAAAADFDKDRRLRATLGSTEARDSLPTIILALRSRALLQKAQAFGKAVNNITDDGQIGAALQSMPLQDPKLSALLFHSAMAHIATPSRLIAATVKLAGNTTEVSLARMQFSPIIDAILAHAQNQLHVLQPVGAFADIDLVCRSLDRFHRLVRSLTGYIEFSRGSRWAMIIAAITKQASDRIEPRLRDVLADLNQAMRRGREGHDKLEEDRVFAAVSGVYLLAAVRESRDSLALNNVFEQAWSQVGQALEMHLQRNLDLIRENPTDPIIGARLDAGFKMAEVRFNPEYAETLRRARASAQRRS